MRAISRNPEDLLYLLQKVGLSPMRGLLRWPFLSRGSAVPLLGRAVKIISPHRLKFGKLCFVGAGTYIDAHARDRVELGRGVTVRESCIIQCRSGLNEPGASLRIGDGTFIGPHCKIGVGGPIDIGANVQLGFSVSINAESHESHEGSYTSGRVSRKGVRVGDGTWVGDGAIILDGVDIGECAVIGAGSVVTRSVAAGAVVAGVPARVLR